MSGVRYAERRRAIKDSHKHKRARKDLSGVRVEKVGR